MAPFDEAEIVISGHAHARGWNRLGHLLEHERTALVHDVLRHGAWYPNPADPEEWFVVANHEGSPLYLAVQVAPPQLLVKTVVVPENPFHLRRIRAGRAPTSATDVARRFGL